jgi:hypothetical protein
VLPKGDRCVFNGTQTFYQISYLITCDEGIERLTVDNPQEFNIQQCENIIKMRSKHACPNYTMYSLSSTIRDNSFLFGLILIIQGLYFIFFAYRFLKFTRILTGINVICFIVLFLIFNNLQIQFNSTIFWLIIIINIIVGWCIGVLISFYPTLVSSILGGFLGFVFTELLFQSIVPSLTWNPQATYYIIFSGSVLIGIILGYNYRKHLFIISCAFLGAYSIIRVKYYIIFIRE